MRILLRKNSFRLREFLKCLHEIGIRTYISPMFMWPFFFLIVDLLEV